MKTREHGRRDYGIIIILILLLGFICIILASGWALRFAPNWKLDTNMGSNLDPNSNATGRPISLIEPVDEAILTNPVWFEYLTPGASFETRTPMPTATTTGIPPKTNTPNPTITATTTQVVIVSPTNTTVYFPPSPLPKTSTPLSTPIPSADLQITKNDFTTTYNPGSSLTYTITVRNNGASAVNGAVVTDNIPAQITTWTWSCTQNGGATGCNTVTGSSVNFTDTVNLPNGASIVYTVTANISLGATSNLVNTANINVPAGYIDPTPGNNSATDTDMPLFNVDLQVTKTDGVATYTPGSSVTYSIVITNPIGPNAANGATVTDSFPAQVASATWVCTPAGGATCTANGSGNINDTVNVPVGGSLTYTVTANTAPSAIGNLVNTAAVTLPVGYIDTNPGNNFATDTDPPVLVSDLGITKTDNVDVYIAGSTLRYIIVVSNAGPSNVNGATVADAFSSNIDPFSITWTCVGSGGASCAATGTGNINDNAVNLPSGSSITYTVNLTVIASPSGNLINTATVSPPAGISDLNSVNDTATDIDPPIPSEIGTNPDGIIYNLMAGTTLTLPINLVANGDSGWDLVYYELPAGSGVLLDWVIIEIGDGQNWYTVFNWNDNIADTNTNVNFNFLTIPVTPPDPEEMDQRDVAAGDLYNGTGIAIDIDSIVPLGTYSFIRFYAPTGPGDLDGHMEIDAIEVLP